MCGGMGSRCLDRDEKAEGRLKEQEDGGRGRR